ncbi:C2HC5 finger protein [Purpureocillium lavendulum]|uniref:Autophagy-related protein 1 n=1 Tax=Purpureocillium lavendulum TaxID=1247861 RepID=A0AB34FPE2_9HYPO|nr:C2HC5 finger protein [Purpureocillium lavendulum]
MPYNSLLLSDLVRDSKLETEVLASCFQHVFYDTGKSALERRVRREERWVRKTFIGRGAYGSVYLEECDRGGGDKTLRAVKEIKKSVAPGDDLDYTRELEAVAKFSHQNYWHCFVRSHGWFELDDSVFITMEYLEHGDLEQHLKSPLPEIEARQITVQVLEGLTFMHQNGFIHRDLKPGIHQNIMVVTVGPDWFVKIADFGISKRRHQGVTTLLTLQRGTFGYAAPEALGFSEGEVYTSSVDMWSLGAVDYRILTGTLAFPGPLDLFQYASGAREFPMAALERNGVSDEGKEFITKLVFPDAKGRLTAKMAAQHPWMTIELPGSASGARQVKTVDDSSAPENDTLVSVASKAWSTDSNATIKAALPLHVREINHEPPSVVDEVEEATDHGVETNYCPPSVSDCPEEPSSQGPKLPADSPVILEPATTPTDVPHAVYSRSKRMETSNSKATRATPAAANGASVSDPPAPKPAPPTRTEAGYTFEGRTATAESDEEPLEDSSEDSPYDSPEQESWGTEEEYASESDGFDETVTCDQCRSHFYLLRDPIERLPCKHYMCHDCLLGLVALSLVSPKYMPPRCCDDPAGLGEINPLAIPDLDLSVEVKDVWTELWKFAELSRTKDWQWRCPRGHPAEDGTLLVSTGRTPVWKTPANCDRCVVSTTLPIRDDLRYQDGQRYQGYCLYCRERANMLECSCSEYFKMVTDSFVKGLRERNAFDTSMGNKIKAGQRTRDKMLVGEPMEFQAWEDVSWRDRPPSKPLVDETPYGAGGMPEAEHEPWRRAPPFSQEDRLSCCRGWSSADALLRGLDNCEIDDWRRQVPSDCKVLWSDVILRESSGAFRSFDDPIRETDEEALRFEEDWQDRRLDREHQTPAPPNPFAPMRHRPGSTRPVVHNAPRYTADDVRYADFPSPRRSPRPRPPSPRYSRYGDYATYA